MSAITAEGKRCPGCSSILASDMFSKNRSTIDGLCVHCKKCRARLKIEFNNRHPGRSKEHRAKYYLNNKLKIAMARKYSHRRVRYEYELHAKYRNLEFNLSQDDFDKLWGKPCFYCGAKIETIGIDRVDNLKGYHTWNVVPCCKACNIAKHTMTKDQYVSLCRSVVEMDKKRI